SRRGSGRGASPARTELTRAARWSSVPVPCVLVFVEDGLRGWSTTWRHGIAIPPVHPLIRTERSCDLITVGTGIPPVQPLRVRGLSPPVRTFTDPGARTTADECNAV